MPLSRVAVAKDQRSTWDEEEVGKDARATVTVDKAALPVGEFGRMGIEMQTKDGDWVEVASMAMDGAVGLDKDGNPCSSLILSTALPAGTIARRFVQVTQAMSITRA